MQQSHTMRRRTATVRTLRRIRHRAKRLLTSYISVPGWTVIALAIISATAFLMLGWHELLAMAVALTAMMIH